MGIYAFWQGGHRRRYLTSGFLPFERKRCACGVMPSTPENRKKYVKLDQGSFVSNILWFIIYSPHVSEELMDALQKERFEGLAFEPTEIVTDVRPSGDRKKLPLDQIPPFYRVKCLTSISLHPDFIELYDVKYCPECGAPRSKRIVESVIYDGRSQPDTDFFCVERYGDTVLCTERGKAFLENYPKTYCDFTPRELRY